MVDQANYDESLVPAFQLPDLLRMNDGRPVSDAAQWPARRGEIIDLYQAQCFGYAPDAFALSGGYTLRAELIESGPALAGRALRKQVALHIDSETASLCVQLLIYIPLAQLHSAEPVPTFMNLNFDGNHCIDTDPEIKITDNWVRDNANSNGHHADAKGRGRLARRYPLTEIMQRGYGFITAYYGDIDPDFDDGFANGAHGLCPNLLNSVEPAARWGSIAAWAWGLRRMLDYCGQDLHIDEQRVAVMGHSRLGKAALWAGALDQRFAVVIANNSGCGGAAIARRCFGETIGAINRQFPHWFCKQHQRYNENENALPFDQHMLLALQAPRPVYIASAAEDQWADPKGEFLGAYHAGPAYRLLGMQGLDAAEWPALNQPHLDGTIAYHLRSGGHDVNAFDWQSFLDFADRHLK